MHEGVAGVHRHIQRRGSGSGIHPNERFRIPRGECQLQCRPVHRCQSTHMQRMVQLPKAHPRTVRPTERSPRAQNTDAQSRDTRETMLYDCVTWSPRACYDDTLCQAHHSFLTRCIGWRNNNHANRPISYLDTLIKTGSESIEAILRRRRILFAECVARMEDMRLPKCVMFGELVGGAGCVGGQEKEWMGCFLNNLRAFGIEAYQWTTAAQNEGEWRRTEEQGAERFGSLQRKSGLDYGIR